MHDDDDETLATIAVNKNPIVRLVSLYPLVGQLRSCHFLECDRFLVKPLFVHIFLFLNPFFNYKKFLFINKSSIFKVYRLIYLNIRAFQLKFLSRHVF